MENLYNIRTALAARICVFYSRCPPDVFCVACTDPGDFLYIIVGFAPGFGFWFLLALALASPRVSYTRLFVFPDRPPPPLPLVLVRNVFGFSACCFREWTGLEGRIVGGRLLLLPRVGVIGGVYVSRVCCCPFLVAARSFLRPTEPCAPCPVFSLRLGSFSVCCTYFIYHTYMLHNTCWEYFVFLCFVFCNSYL